LVVGYNPVDGHFHATTRLGDDLLKLLIITSASEAFAISTFKPAQIRVAA
jgi:hypothetical protein